MCMLSHYLVIPFPWVPDPHWAAQSLSVELQTRLMLQKDHCLTITTLQLSSTQFLLLSWTAQKKKLQKQRHFSLRSCLQRGVLPFSACTIVDYWLFWFSCNLVWISTNSVNENLGLGEMAVMYQYLLFPPRTLQLWIAIFCCSWWETNHIRKNILMICLAYQMTILLRFMLGHERAGGCWSGKSHWDLQL